MTENYYIQYMSYFQNNHSHRGGVRKGSSARVPPALTGWKWSSGLFFSGKQYFNQCIIAYAIRLWLGLLLMGEILGPIRSGLIGQGVSLWKRTSYAVLVLLIKKLACCYSGWMFQFAPFWKVSVCLRINMTLEGKLIPILTIKIHY